MTIEEARKIEKAFVGGRKNVDEDFFLYTEAMDYLIREDDNPRDALYLGLEYLYRNRYEAARRYFELAAMSGVEMAVTCLGDMYYYGQGVEVDYKKALDYYRQAYAGADPAARGFSGLILATMYHKGQYVERDTQKSKEIALAIYNEAIADENVYNFPDHPLCELLGDICLDEGNEEEAIRYYEEGVESIAKVDIIKPDSDDNFDQISDGARLMKKLYQIPSYQPTEFNLMSLHILMEQPAEVSFMYEGRRYYAQSVDGEDGMCYTFNDKEYRSVDEMMNRARIDGRRLETLFYDIDKVEVIS